MKMIVAVVRDEYVGALTDNLTKAKYSATKLASTGGFLRAGNTTFLIGVDEEKVPDVLHVIKGSCPERPAPVGGTAIAGATVFVLGVDRMVKV